MNELGEFYRRNSPRKLSFYERTSNTMAGAKMLVGAAAPIDSPVVSAGRTMRVGEAAPVNKDAEPKRLG